MAAELSALERAKKLADLARGHALFSRLARGDTEVTAEDEVVLRWHGLFRQRPPEAGLFTFRLKLPNGALTAAQAMAIAGIAEESGGGRVDLTTRQNLEVHSIAASQLEAIFALLRTVGLTTPGACGDVVRNVVGCPAAGLDPEALLDTRPTVEALTASFSENRDFANLPRKFKIAVCGCGRHCVPTEINDVALDAVFSEDGSVEYLLGVGGGLSTSPAFAQPLARIGVGEAVEVVAAVVATFRDYGNRENRTRARLKHLLAEWGLDRFRQEIEARIGRPLRRPGAIAPHRSTGRDHLGVLPQGEEGRCLVGVPVPTGVLNPKQVSALATLARDWGNGRLCVTPYQNILLPGIMSARVEAVLAALADCGLPVNENSWAGRTVVCAGREFCNKAVTQTKSWAHQLIGRLEELVPAAVDLRISGCPNGCGQHQLGAIGLQGSVAQGEIGREECFDLWVRAPVGGVLADFGRRVASRLRPTEVPAAVADWARRLA